MIINIGTTIAITVLSSTPWISSDVLLGSLISLTSKPSLTNVSAGT